MGGTRESQDLPTGLSPRCNINRRGPVGSQPRRPTRASHEGLTEEGETGQRESASALRGVGPSPDILPIPPT